MKKSILFYISLFLLPFTLQGCLDSGESDYEKQVREDDEAIRAYLETNGIEAEEQSSGVYIEIVEENEDGQEVVEDHVAGILYTMTHMAGEYEVESHSDSLNPLRFSYSYDAGFNAIHPTGLNYEIGKMKLGETFRFYIPSYQAFGNYSHDDLFDEYSNFIVEVELIELKTEEEIYEEEVDIIRQYIEDNSIEAESYPNGLYYSVIEEGDGDSPDNSSQVRFHFTRKYLDGTVIETTTGDDPAEVYMNNNNMVSGLEGGIGLMKEGEKALLIMPSKMAFGKSVQVIPQELREDWVEEWIENDEEPPFPPAKPYSSVIYEVELLEVN